MILEATNEEELKQLVSRLDRSIYVMYITSSGDIIYRPTVTTRGRDTIILKEQSQETCDRIQRWYGTIIRIKNYSFREDVIF